MKELKDAHSSSYLKLRESTSNPNRLINDRGDFVIVKSPKDVNVNSDKKHNVTDALKAIGKWGK